MWPVLSLPEEWSKPQDEFSVTFVSIRLVVHISGHGSTGEYIAQSNKVSYNTEKVPKRIPVYVEKGRDNRPNPVDFPEIIDIACGTNHSVRKEENMIILGWGSEL